MNTTYAISIVFGIVLGHLIIKLYYPEFIYHGPDSNKIRGVIYYDHKTQTCYKYTPKAYICPLYG